MFIHVPVCIIIVTLHSYARAAVSLALGDNAPVNQGRLTFNPVKHFDALSLICFIFFGLGWSKPMDTKRFNYRGDKRKSELVAAVLPLAVILLFAGISSAAAHITAAAGGISYINDILNNFAFFSLAFVIFNLIPIYPLDGARIVAVVKPGWWIKIHGRERTAQTVLMALLCFNILGAVIKSFVDGILGFIIN
jgi:Zn-dependent protease